MITSSKKVIYNVIEITREEALLILLGETIENYVSRKEENCEPSIYRIYCSSPTTLDELYMQLEFRRENNEKKEQEKGCCSFKG